MQSPLRVKRQVCEGILRHARENPLAECCGLLAGRAGIITQAFEAVNAASDPTKFYEIAPMEIFKCMREFRSSGLELLGIYHSHPGGDNSPSERDVEQAYYPETPYFILSPLPGARQPIRAFLIRHGVPEELDIQFL